MTRLLLGLCLALLVSSVAYAETASGTSGLPIWLGIFSGLPPSALIAILARQWQQAEAKVAKLEREAIAHQLTATAALVATLREKVDELMGLLNGAHTSIQTLEFRLGGVEKTVNEHDQQLPKRPRAVADAAK